MKTQMKTSVNEKSNSSLTTTKTKTPIKSTMKQKIKLIKWCVLGNHKPCMLPSISATELKFNKKISLKVKGQGHMQPVLFILYITFIRHKDRIAITQGKRKSNTHSNLCLLSITSLCKFRYSHKLLT